MGREKSKGQGSQQEGTGESTSGDVVYGQGFLCRPGARLSGARQAEWPGAAARHRSRTRGPLFLFFSWCLFLIGFLFQAKTQKNENSNLHGFELYRPSSKGTKLLSRVIKAIINQFSGSFFVIFPTSDIFSNFFLEIGQGLRLKFCGPCTPTNPFPA